MALYIFFQRKHTLKEAVEFYWYRKIGSSVAWGCTGYDFFLPEGLRRKNTLPSSFLIASADAGKHAGAACVQKEWFARITIPPMRSALH